VQTFRKQFGCWPTGHERPEYWHCNASCSLVEEHDGNEKLPWVISDAFLDEDRLDIEESFVSVKRCEEEGSVAGRIGQETEVVLPYIVRVCEVPGDKEQPLFGCVLH